MLRRRQSIGSLWRGPADKTTDLPRSVVLRKVSISASWHAIWGPHLIDAKRFDHAIDEALRATELEPNYFLAQHLEGET